MSWLGARFFSLVQTVAFYQSIHRQAVDLLPPGHGRTWLDIGCGPGLVARFAAERGYDTVGLDLDPAMVQRARTLASRTLVTGQRPPVFRQGSVFDLPAQAPAVDVVSAASLLTVLPNRREGLLALLSAVKPGGQVLLIEPSAQMTPAHVASYLAAHPGTNKAWVSGSGPAPDHRQARWVWRNWLHPAGRHLPTRARRHGQCLDTEGINGPWVTDSPTQVATGN